MLGTRHCHVANRQGECERKDLYYDFRCAELKAMHFTVLKELPSCLTQIKGGNSLFGDYYKYCESLTDVERANIPLLLDFDEDQATYNTGDSSPDKVQLFIALYLIAIGLFF